MSVRASVAAVVLAAGASTRMGKPKALLKWRERAFVTHVIEAAHAAACAPIVVIEGAIPLPDELLGHARRVHNHEWRAGQLSSLQKGLQALVEPAPSGVLVLTVDRPHVRPATLSSLVAAHVREPAAIWQPAHAGRRGHPILYPADLVAALLALGPDASPRVLLGRAEIAMRRKTIAVDDPATLENLDRPEDLERLPPRDADDSM